jgi:transposase-like protein
MMKRCNGSFKGRHFDRQIIVLCVSWYVSFKQSLRELVMIMPDRGISVTHTTILALGTMLWSSRRAFVGHIAT